MAAEPFDQWRLNVLRATGQGKRFDRVRLVDNPLTEGQYFLLTTASNNVAAREDIRNLFRRDAARLGLPDFDFWLFDSRILARFVFGGDEPVLGVVLTEDPADSDSVGGGGRQPRGPEGYCRPFSVPRREQ